MLCPYTVFVGLFITMIHAATEYYNEEHRLSDLIVKNYDASIAPTKFQAGKVIVKFGYMPVRIQYMDSASGTVGLQAWIDLEWIDERLSWDTRNFTGVSALVISSSKIWTPNILVSTSPYSNKIGFHVNPVVYSNGTVRLVINDLHDVYCKFRIKKFPYDDFECFFIFTSPQNKLNFKLKYHSLDIKKWYGRDFGQWNVHSKSMFSFGSGLHTAVGYFINFSRKPNQYFATYVIPGVVMSCLVPFIFLVPGQTTQEKQYLGTGITIGLTLLTMMVDTEDAVPLALGDPPNLVLMYNINLLLAILALVISLWLDYINHTEGSRPAPLWLNKFFVKFGKLFGIERRSYASFRNEDDSASDEDQSLLADWSQVITVLNKFLFIIFVCIIIIVDSIFVANLIPEPLF